MHTPRSLCTPKTWSKGPENWSFAYCLSVLEEYQGQHVGSFCDTRQGL